MGYWQQHPPVIAVWVKVPDWLAKVAVVSAN